jgi:carotenoid cleavage dioxygenase-like enzyme
LSARTSCPFDIDPCYVFHVANAYDRGNSIVLQAVRYPELWRNDGSLDVDGVMWRWTIDLENGAVDERQLDDRSVEFSESTASVAMATVVRATTV